MKIGFTAFCTSDFSGIMDNLVRSIIAFSRYDITVYSINFDYVFDSNRVNVKRVNICNLNLFKIFQTKIYAAIDSGYDIGLMLDGDMIVTREIDKIFDENEGAVLKAKYPLFSKHPHNPFVNPNHTKEVMGAIRKYTDKLPKMKYVYASCLFSNENKWFLKDVYDRMSESEIGGSDELVINALLTQYQVDYDIGYNYFPNATDNLINCYLNNDQESCKELYETYVKHNCPVKFYLFHGHKCKDVKYMSDVIDKIKGKHA